MKALVKSYGTRGLWLEDVAEPVPGINDVKIRVLLTGICGTDLHIYDWDQWAQSAISVPTIIGHEFVGEIVALGSTSRISCGKYCQRRRPRRLRALPELPCGRRHLCAHTQGVGVNRAGAFAEFVVLPMTNVWRHTSPIPLDTAAIFDPFGNAVHTALSFPVLGEDVLVTGAGPIGIMAALVARTRRRTSRRDHGRESLPAGPCRSAGVAIAVNTQTERLNDVQKRLAMKEGFDVGLEMSGAPAAFREMLENMSHGGKIAMLGIPSTEIAIDWHQVIFNMLTIKGIYGREMFETWYKMTVMLESGLDISPVITHRFPWQEYQKGFDVLRSGNSGKVLLDWRAAS